MINPTYLSPPPPTPHPDRPTASNAEPRVGVRWVGGMVPRALRGGPSGKRARTAAFSMVPFGS
eukprot:6020832-Prymnesium_polylepis.1